MENLSKNNALSLLIAGGVAFSLHWSGSMALPLAEKTAENELALAAKNISHALSQASPSDLQSLLNDITADSYVVAAVVRSPEEKVIAFSRTESLIPHRRLFQKTFPLQNDQGQKIGSVALELNSRESPAVQRASQKVWAVSSAGFVISFLFLFYLLNRKDIFINQFLISLKKVTEGNLDASLAVPEHGDFVDVAEAFNRMLEGLHERDRMRHSLGRIMDPKIAEILIKEDPKVGGLRRQTTILFCDIRNYTSLCEQLSSDELQAFLNEYWKDTVEIIMEQEGTIDKFHGDGVCVVFGAPILHDDDPLRATRTAWRLVQNVDLINKRREAARKMPIQIGIGIHTGEVIAGHIGSERRMDYTVVGDAVNVAARIEELNKKFGTKILISDNVYEKVEPHVRVKTLTLAYLRGHKRPILVHALREFLETPVATGNAAEPSPQQKAA